MKNIVDKWLQEQFEKSLKSSQGDREKALEATAQWSGINSTALANFHLLNYWED